MNNNDFDKQFNRIFKFSWLAAAVGVVLSLALTGVSIWAIIYVVTHIGVWFG